MFDASSPRRQGPTRLAEPRHTPRGELAGGRTVKNFRLDPAQLAILDGRQAELRVESRSELITAIVGLGIQR